MVLLQLQEKYYIQMFIVGYSIRPRLTKANKESKYSIFGEELAILIIKGI